MKVTMKMNKRQLLYTFALCLLLPACSQESELPASPTGEGTEATAPLLDISFSLPAVSPVPPATAVAPSRAVTTVPLAAGTTFRVYAYPQGGSVTADTPQAGTYTVQAGGTATGALRLYRGTYDLYLVSYNTNGTPPEISGGKISVENSKDFMYTTLKNVVVQPSVAGATSLSIPVSTPFTHLGAQVTVSAKVKNGNQPVAVAGMRVNYITIKKLSSARNYTLGMDSWSTDAGPVTYTESLEYKTFTRSDDSYHTPWISTPGVLLPVDGSVNLEFDVNLKVTYGSTTEDILYTPSILKALKPGMKYNFEFTLTFYGVITPTDLTLAVKEWNEIDLETDNMGGGN